MKSMRLITLSLLLSHSFSSLYAVKFEYGLQPVMKVYSLITMQHIFNAGLVGALGWVSYKNWQLGKAFKTHRENSKKTFDSLVDFKTNDFLTKEDADTAYLPKSKEKDFVQKTQAGKEDLAAALVSIAVPILNKQFVNINAFTSLQEQVKDCATKEGLKEIETDARSGLNAMNKDFIIVKDKVTKLETDHNELQQSVIKANQNILTLLKEQKTHSEALQKILEITTSLTHKIDTLHTNQPLINALAPSVVTAALSQKTDAETNTNT